MAFQALVRKYYFADTLILNVPVRSKKRRIPVREMRLSQGRDYSAGITGYLSCAPDDVRTCSTASSLPSAAFR